jgi:hypothetical protein
MDHYSGQIAEYGTIEFENNKSIYTVLERGVYVNPHGIKNPCELYHRTAGYKIAGSCAIWVKEMWGYKMIYSDGTNGGKMFLDKNEALTAWSNLNKE